MGIESRERSDRPRRMEGGDIDTLDWRTQLVEYSKIHKPRTLFSIVLLTIL